MDEIKNERDQLKALEDLYSQQKYSEALILGEQLCSDFPDSFHINILYIKVLQELDRVEEAEEKAKDLNQMFPDNINLLLELGDVTFKLNKYKESIEYFNRVLFLDPFNTLAKDALDKIEAHAKTSGEAKESPKDFVSYQNEKLHSEGETKEPDTVKEEMPDINVEVAEESPPPIPDLEEEDPTTKAVEPPQPEPQEEIIEPKGEDEPQEEEPIESLPEPEKDVSKESEELQRLREQIEKQGFQPTETIIETPSMSNLDEIEIVDNQGFDSAFPGGGADTSPPSPIPGWDDEPKKDTGLELDTSEPEEEVTETPEIPEISEEDLSAPETSTDTQEPEALELEEEAVEPPSIPEPEEEVSMEADAEEEALEPKDELIEPVPETEVREETIRPEEPAGEVPESGEELIEPPPIPESDGMEIITQGIEKQVEEAEPEELIEPPLIPESDGMQIITQGMEKEVSEEPPKDEEPAEPEVKGEEEKEFVTKSAAELYMSQGLYEDAYKIYKQLYAANPEDDILLKLNQLKKYLINQKTLQVLTNMLEAIKKKGEEIV
jgi:tetratricopeptide (TPR) repeat protein